MTGRMLTGLVMGLASVLSLAAEAAEPSIHPDEWTAYKQAFVSPEGRVVDTYNGNISHSEGQGYGMLLAYLADDRETFNHLWSFTQTELMVRDDGLPAWKWDPAATPHVSDLNNASDGDILIAYSLGLAGQRWQDQAFLTSARDLTIALGSSSTMRSGNRLILLPGAAGFGPNDQPDGPIVNLSYWVFEAFPLLGQLAPSTNWDLLATNGLQLVALSKFGTTDLPSDWISLQTSKPAPAELFTAEFGYNSIRIPLYLLRAGITQKVLLEHFIAPLSGDQASTRLVADGEPVSRLTEPGFRIIGAAVNCVLNDEPVPASLAVFEPQSYFGSTLHLLTLSFLRQHASRCL